MDDFIGRLAANAGVNGRAAVKVCRISLFLSAPRKAQCVSAMARSPVVDSRLD